MCVVELLVGNLFVSRDQKSVGRVGGTRDLCFYIKNRARFIANL
jgi:hypothetical protein